MDGNKRTGYVLGLLLLMNTGLDIHATQDEKYEFVISSDQIEFDEIKKWINEKSW